MKIVPVHEVKKVFLGYNIYISHQEAADITAENVKLIMPQHDETRRLIKLVQDASMEHAVES